METDLIEEAVEAARLKFAEVLLGKDLFDVTFGAILVSDCRAAMRAALLAALRKIGGLDAAAEPRTFGDARLDMACTLIPVVLALLQRLDEVDAAITPIERRHGAAEIRQLHALIHDLRAAGEAFIGELEDAASGAST